MSPSKVFFGGDNVTGGPLYVLVKDVDRSKWVVHKLSHHGSNYTMDFFGRNLNQIKPRFSLFWVIVIRHHQGTHNLDIVAVLTCCEPTEVGKVPVRLLLALVQICDACLHALTGPVEECRVFKVAPGVLTYASCLQPLPSVCRYRKGMTLCSVYVDSYAFYAGVPAHLSPGSGG